MIKIFPPFFLSFILVFSLLQPICAMEDEEAASGISPSKPCAEGFSDGGDRFVFRTEMGEQNQRTLADYEIQKQELYDGVCKVKALVFGGMHLTPKEAFALSKRYAQEGRLDLIINIGVPLHGGHTVINLDPNTCPDHVADFTEKGLIQRLSLMGQFSLVVFENVRPIFTLNLDALRNAWDALSPGGRLVNYPSNLLHQIVFTSLGYSFENYKFIGSGYRDLLRDTTLDFPACVITKPKDQDKK